MFQFPWFLGTLKIDKKSGFLTKICFYDCVIPPELSQGPVLDSQCGEQRTT